MPAIRASCPRWLGTPGSAHRRGDRRHPARRPELGTRSWATPRPWTAPSCWGSAWAAALPRHRRLRWARRRGCRTARFTHEAPRPWNNSTAAGWPANIVTLPCPAHGGWSFLRGGAHAAGRALELASKRTLMPPAVPPPVAAVRDPGLERVPSCARVPARLDSRTRTNSPSATYSGRRLARWAKAVGTCVCGCRWPGASLQRLRPRQDACPAGSNSSGAGTRPCRPFGYRGSAPS